MTAAIETRGLTKRYGSVLALDGLDLDIEAGEIFGLLGPNGAGKSTTLRLLLGFARPTAGSARIAGFDVLADLASAHRHVAFVAGDLALWPQLTGRETLDFLGALHGDFDADYREELIKRFSLEPDKRVREYSKGNRQKVGLIGAFMTRASVLIFDEPTSGLDPLMELAFRQCVLEAKASGQTALVSSHILSEVEAICDRVGILRAGRLVDVGTLDEMRGLSARVVEATFAGPPPDIAHVEGVSDVSVDGNVVRCHVRGPMTQLMRVLADAGAIDLSSREPSLEELFLAHYGDDSAATESDVRRRRPRATAGDEPIVMGSDVLVGRFVLRMARRGAIVWAAVVFVSVAGTIKGFEGVYPHLADRQKFAASLAGNTGFAALLGVPRHVETAGGFLAWRIGVLLSVILSIWALLLASRVLRGEEDAGRWETLATGPRSTPRLTGAAIGAIAVACLAPFIGGVLGALAVASGTGIRVADVCWFALGVALCALAFAIFAAMASQLFAPRARVSTVAGIALAVAYLIRLVADSSTRFGWLRWCSPLGWLEELHAFSGTRPAVLLLFVAWSLAFGATAVALARRRDVGAAIIATQGLRSDRSVRFGNPIVDAFRFVRGSVTGWTAGAAIAGFVMGILAPSAAKAVRDSDFANKFGGALGGNIGTAAGYLGATFVFVIATLIAISPSSHLASVREEEETGRLETFLAGLTSRRTWIWSRVAVALTNALLMAIGAAVFAWLGLRVAGDNVGIEHLLGATLCYVPLAAAFGGLGLAVFGVAPRATQGLIATLVGVAALIELIGSLTKAPSWFLDLSPFFHLGNAPAEPARPVAALVLLGFGAVCAVFGVEVFARRDLSSM